MNPDFKIPVLVVLVSLVAGSAPAAAGRIEHIDTYRSLGVENADAQRGRQLWFAVDGGRGCTSCHGDAPADAGKHVKTGKPIEPMAPSINPRRYRSARTIEKWFLRNCKWTYGRECSAQEKADILTWLAGQ